MLNPKQRELIERILSCKVYDGYGLNDGAITAFECQEHNGYHIDMERGFLEVVNERGEQVINQEGKILATTLIEQCMPLIRYDTGDLGVYSNQQCKCGIAKPLLKALKRRATDFLKINGKVVSSPVLTVLMGKTHVINYQIEQVSENKIIVRMVYQNQTNLEQDVGLITESLKSKLGDFELEIQVCDEIYVEPGRKHKFILNNMV